MKIDFTDRKALVTGSTSGIGLAVAKGFLAAGASVVVNGRGRTGVDEVVARLGGTRAKAVGFAEDLGPAADCDRLLAAHPDIDILVNNLGIYEPQDFFRTPDETWERFFQTNVMSGVRLARAFAPGLAERG